MRQRRGPRRTPAPLVDAVWARRVVAELDRAGLPTSELLSAVGLRLEQLSEPDALIPFDAHVRLFENAARALDEPCFGYRVGSTVGLTEAGLLAYVTLNSQDLGGALRNLCRYLRDPDRRGGLRAATRGRRGPAAVLLRGSRRGGQPAAARVRRHAHGPGLRHDHRPSWAAAAGRAASRSGLPPTWPGTSACRWRSTSRALRSSWTPRRSRCRWSMPTPACSTCCGAMPTTCWRDARAVTTSWPGPSAGWSTISTPATSARPRLARALGMSERTLARRLAEDGLTPAGLVDDLRRRLADRYLAARGFPLGRITYLLGYSDLSAFTRAFRRWTGRTPSEWRAELSQALRSPASPAPQT